MQEPRAQAEELERHPEVPVGADERFSGYGSTGVPFVSGHYLALRRFPASSLDAPYTTVWHRDPDGAWTVYSNVSPELSCPRFLGRALARVVVTTIAISWTSDRALRVTIPGRLEWEMELTTNVFTRVMAVLGSRTSLRVRRNRLYLALRAWFSSALLRIGRFALQGLMPNDQWFQAAPRVIWLVHGSRARLCGLDLGAVAPLARQERLRDFWLPQRGLFFLGEVFFEPLAALGHDVILPPVERMSSA